MLKRLKLNIPSPYVSKAMDIDTLKRAMDYELGVVHSLYCIKNDVKDKLPFAEIDSKRFDLMAHVRVRYALVGDAKAQAWEVKPFSKLLKIQPEYTFICTLTSKRSNRVIYFKKHITKNVKLVYDLIEDSFQDLQILLGSYE